MGYICRPDDSPVGSFESRREPQHKAAYVRGTPRLEGPYGRVVWTTDVTHERCSGVRGAGSGQPERTNLRSGASGHCGRGSSLPTPAVVDSYVLNVTDSRGAADLSATRSPTMRPHRWVPLRAGCGGISVHEYRAQNATLGVKKALHLNAATRLPFLWRRPQGELHAIIATCDLARRGSTATWSMTPRKHPCRDEC